MGSLDRFSIMYLRFIKLYLNAIIIASLIYEFT